MRCHGTKCPLSKAFFSHFFPPRLLCSNKGASGGVINIADPKNISRAFGMYRPTFTQGHFIPLSTLGIVYRQSLWGSTKYFSFLFLMFSYVIQLLLHRDMVSLCHHNRVLQNRMKITTVVNTYFHINLKVKKQVKSITVLLV